MPNGVDPLGLNWFWNSLQAYDDYVGSTARGLAKGGKNFVVKAAVGAKDVAHATALAGGHGTLNIVNGASVLVGGSVIFEESTEFCDIGGKNLKNTREAIINVSAEVISKPSIVTDVALNKLEEVSALPYEQRLEAFTEFSENLVTITATVAVVAKPTLYTGSGIVAVDNFASNVSSKVSIV